MDCRSGAAAAAAGGGTAAALQAALTSACHRTRAPRLARAPDGRGRRKHRILSAAEEQAEVAAERVLTRRKRRAVQVREEAQELARVRGQRARLHRVAARAGRQAVVAVHQHVLQAAAARQKG